MHTTTTITNTYVLGCVNWLFPANVNLTAIPKAFELMTVKDPTVPQIEM
jgi:hypothetical protein